MKANRPILLAGAALGLAAVAAYHNTFGVPFLFDDDPSIVYNKSIQHLWPLAGPLAPPGDHGETVGGRPLLNLTLAVNHAISGLDVWSYHAVNLLIHGLAGLTLFGVVRRTLGLSGGLNLWRVGLLTDRGPSGDGPSSLNAAPGTANTPRSRSAGPPLLAEGNQMLAAFVIALLWTLHPLQTESVTYIVQRAESLMGLFYLLTLYCFVRAVERNDEMAGNLPTGPTETAGRDRPIPPSSVDRRDQRSRPTKKRQVAWQIASVAACFLGAGCKEVIATAPLVVLLYDRTFVAGGFREAWRRRHWYYGGLMATWPLLLWLVLATGGTRGGTFGLTPEAFGGYWLTQFAAVTRYLQLSFSPAPLVFDYGRFQVEHLAGILPQVLLVGGLLAATGWALGKRPVAGFLGATFFLVLAPTSVMPGLTQVMAEHRMYLPLAALLALVVGGVTARLGRPALVVFVGLAFGAGVATERRNAAYHDALGLWRDTVQKRPGSAFAQANVGTLLYRRGQVAEAMPFFVEALRLDPAMPQIHFNLGLAYDQSGRRADAMAHFAEAVRLLPEFAQAHAMLGAGLLRAGRPAEAEEHLRIALGTMPAMPEMQFLAGVALVETGRVPGAIARFSEALRQKPGYAEAESELGMALFRMNAPGADALRHLERAVQVKPALVVAHYNLAVVLAETGRTEEAARQLAEALRLAPDFAAAKEMLEQMKATPAKP